MAVPEEGVRNGRDLEGDWEVVVGLRVRNERTGAEREPVIYIRHREMNYFEACTSVAGLIFVLSMLGYALSFCRHPASFLVSKNNSYHSFSFVMVVYVLFVVDLLMSAVAMLGVMKRRGGFAKLFGGMQFRVSWSKRSDVPVLGRVLFLLVPRRSRDHLVGDLEEEYQKDILLFRSWFRARCWWWRQVLGIVGPYLVKRVKRVLGLEVVRGWRRR